MKKKKYKRLEPEQIRVAVEAVGISVLLAYLFYDAFWGIVVVAVVYPLYRGRRTAEFKERQKKEMETQFCDGISCAAAALEAGYSMENAWKEAEQEIATIHGRDAVLAKTFHRMNRRIAMNEPIEMQIQEFARRTNLESVQNFADIFGFAKRSGGNLTAIIKKTTHSIRLNAQVKEEIDTMLSSRKLEQKIMNMMPLGILLYIRIGVNGFLDPLYHTVSGVLIMSICLSAYLGVWEWSRRVADIRI